MERGGPFKTNLESHRTNLRSLQSKQTNLIFFSSCFLLLSKLRGSWRMESTLKLSENPSDWSLAKPSVTVRVMSEHLEN